MNENKFIKLKKLEVIFLIIPLLIVLYMFVSNLVSNMNGYELNFRMEAYDPYDIIRGKYLDINFVSEKIVIPELCGNYHDADNFMNAFVLRYKELNDEDKDKVCKILDDMANFAVLRFNSFGDRVLRDKDYMNFYIEDIKTIDDKLLIKDKNDEFASYMYQLLIAMKNSNLTSRQMLDEIKVVKYDDIDKKVEADRKNNNKTIYIYYKKDDDGFAKIDTISLEKIKGRENDAYLKEKVQIYNWYTPDMLDYFTIANRSKEYYIDERKVEDADRIINKALQSGKDVYVSSKISNGTLQFDTIYIDGIELDVILSNYKDEDINDLD